MNIETVNRQPADISYAAVMQLSQRLGEPESWRRQRLAAWEAYEALDWPTGREETWRRTRVEPFAEVRFAAAPEGADGRQSADAALPPLFRENALLDGGASVIRQTSFADPHLTLSDEARAAGVTLLSFTHAAVRTPEAVEALLGRCVPYAAGKLEALHRALLQEGLVVCIPAGVELTGPLFGSYWHAHPDVAAFRHVLIDVGAGASATVIDACGSAPASAFRASRVTEIHLDANARLQYVQAQQWGAEVVEWSHSRAVLGRDASLRWVTATFGGAVVKSFVETVLRSPGASATLGGLQFAGGQQHLDLHSLQEHVAPHATSDLLAHAVLTGHSRSVYRGVIRIHPDAQHSDAYQKNRNLFLSSGARADSIPTLEIEANEVRCTHGATSSDLDAEELFYLQSRGLDEAAARELLVEGFVRPALDRVDAPAVQAVLLDSVRQKLSAIEMEEAHS